MFLGGPLAAAIVTAVGTTDERELRGRVPWYGTLFNHASATAAIVVAGFVYDGLRGVVAADDAFIGFLIALVSSAVFFLLTWGLAVLAVTARTADSVRTVWAQDVRPVALPLAGLAPVAWLMAQVFMLPNGIGWWATPLFVVPLYTTRDAYARYVETRELFEQTIEALSHAVDARDRYTKNHSSRVSKISEAMCRELRLPESEIEKVKWAGLLHDIGKIGIRDHILLKEGPLDKSERTTMNKHPEIGALIVEPATQLRAQAPLIHAHHEWWNGSGYPQRLETDGIPLGARIMSIADAYEAMTSSRPYRKTPLTHEQAVEQLTKFSGIQFDPELVPIFLGLDRTILDPPPDTDEESPTTLHPDEVDRLAQERAAVMAANEAPHTTAATRPALASDDVS